MTLSINNAGYAFLIRFDLMFCAIMKSVPIVTNFKRPTIKHLIKLILYENDVKLYSSHCTGCYCNSYCCTI